MFRNFPVSINSMPPCDCTFFYYHSSIIDSLVNFHVENSEFNLKFIKMTEIRLKVSFAKSWNFYYFDFVIFWFVQFGKVSKGTPEKSHFPHKIHFHFRQTTRKWVGKKYAIESGKRFKMQSGTFLWKHEKKRITSKLLYP